MFHRRSFLRVAALGLVWFLPTVGSAAADAAKDFSVVLLPDTQYYSEKHPDIYCQQAQWIKEQAETRNIKFVIHLGDIVDKATEESQWKAADAAHKILDGAVPYSVLPGNHDMEENKRVPERRASLYGKYFPPSRFEGCPWYGGNEDGTNDNNYCRFEAAGMKFLVLSLEWDPMDATYAWADDVLRRHADHRAIVATHCYLFRKGRDEIGQRMWDKLIRKHANVFLVVCGHHWGANRSVAETDAGTPVIELMTDYQNLPNGGQGWLRILRFAPAENTIHVEAYSPKLDRRGDDPAETFSVEYAMESGKP
ncbi:MAG: metallophosphoesterase [Pirellulales bacterium]|nr:metallophosphoesterase [Pirellulales bacterium]